MDILVATPKGERERETLAWNISEGERERDMNFIKMDRSGKCYINRPIYRYANNGQGTTLRSVCIVMRGVINMNILHTA